jgi:hypothetical protein
MGAGRSPDPSIESSKEPPAEPSVRSSFKREPRESELALDEVESLARFDEAYPHLMRILSCEKWQSAKTVAVAFELPELESEIGVKLEALFELPSQLVEKRQQGGVVHYRRRFTIQQV